MDPPQKGTPNHHDGRSKRHRIESVSSPNSPTITCLIATRDDSPLASVNVNLTQLDGPSQDDGPVPSVDTSSIARTSASTAAASAPAASAPAALASSVSTVAPASAPATAEQDSKFSEWSEGDNEDLLSAQPPSPSNVATLPRLRPPTPPPVYYAKTSRFEELASIPEAHKRIISGAIKELYPFIDDTRQFQLEGTNHLSFNDDASLVMIRRTADGKSLVPLTTSYIRKGVTICLVPLHGLGSDQVEKAASETLHLEAYYVDEHRGESADALE